MMVAGVYKRWTRVQLPFHKEKGPHAKHYTPKQTCDKRERRQMWKSVYYGESKGRWRAWS